MTDPEKVKHIRHLLGLKQEEFAKGLKIAQASLSAIETGKVSVSNKIRQRLYDVYHVRPEWMAAGVGSVFRDHNKYSDDKSRIIAALEDQIILLKDQLSDKEKIIRMLETQLPDKSRTNSR